jgi:hypothetical protein
MGLCSLFSCNAEAKIVPSSLFYNRSVPTHVNMSSEWDKFLQSDVSTVFNFFSYPFLFPVEAKLDLIRSHFARQMQYQVGYCHSTSI